MLQKTIAIFLLILTFTLSASTQNSENSNYSLGLSDKDWKLEFNLKGWEVMGTRGNEGGTAKRFDAQIKDEGFRLTIMMVTAQKKGSSKELREIASKSLEQSPVKKDNYKKVEYNEIPTLEYLVKEFRGVKMDQKHYNAYISKDGVWVDIHLSKVGFKSGDEKRFFAILDSLEFKD